MFNISIINKKGYEVNWERIEPWDYIVANVANEYSKKFKMVELNDIKQSLYQWFLEHPNKLDEWEAIGKKDAKNLIYRSLRNQALDYCQEWKAKSVGYDVGDLHYYDPDTVERILPNVFLDKASATPKIMSGLPGKPPAPNETGNAMVMLIEVESAYNKLNTEDRTVLFYKYALSYEYDAIAKEMDLSSGDAARMRHNRAIRKLINRIGGFKPYHDSDTVEQPQPLEQMRQDPIVNNEEYYRHD